VFSKADKPQRSLLCLCRTSEPVSTVESQLVIHAADGSYSAQYQHLLGAFYLKFPDGAANL
jgi:tRNA1Val (adenine37-N6)-methyltransferase